MRLLAIALALLIGAIGAVGVASPSLLIDFVRPLLAPGALLIVAAVRVLYGVVLLLVARVSRWPGTFRVLGILIVAAGLLTALAGADRAQAMVDWWSGRPDWFTRAWALLAVAFGGFVVHALVSRKQDDA